MNEYLNVVRELNSQGDKTRTNSTNKEAGGCLTVQEVLPTPPGKQLFVMSQRAHLNPETNCLSMRVLSSLGHETKA